MVSFANARRHFLQACLALGGTGIAHASLATTRNWAELDGLPLDNRRNRLVYLRHAATDVGNASAYVQLRKAFATRAISPGLRDWIGGLGDDAPLGFEAIVEIRRDGDRLGYGAVLDFNEYYWPVHELDVANARLDFDQWLVEFDPKGRDDLLMALPLYHLYRQSGLVVPMVRSTPDPWLDGLLHSTRGMLLWSHQWTTLVCVIGGMGSREARRLIRDYQLGCPEAYAALRDKPQRATRQSLLQIIEERSPMRCSLGSPDFAVGNWLVMVPFT